MTERENHNTIFFVALLFFSLITQLPLSSHIVVVNLKAMNSTTSFLHCQFFYTTNLNCKRKNIIG